jgi:hypothetical protein
VLQTLESFDLPPLLKKSLKPLKYLCQSPFYLQQFLQHKLAQIKSVPWRKGWNIQV